MRRIEDGTKTIEGIQKIPIDKAGETATLPSMCSELRTHKDTTKKEISGITKRTKSI